MKILTDTDEAFALMCEHVAKKPPGKCLIATFSLWVGIRETGEDCHQWGGKYANPAHEFLDSLIEHGVSTRVLVGTPNHYPCTDDCPHCRAKFVKQWVRIGQTVKAYNHSLMVWRVRECHHAKLILFNDGYCMIGGRNLTSSDWTDFSFWLQDNKLCKKLAQEFDVMWKESKRWPEVTSPNGLVLTPNEMSMLTSG